MMSQVLETARQHDDRMLAGLAHNYMAGSYYHWGRWSEALKHIDEAIALRIEVGDMAGLAMSVDNRGQILNRCGRYAEAKESCESGLKTVSEAGVALMSSANLYSEIGLANLHMGNFAAAEHWFRRHLAYAKECGSDGALRVSYSHLGLLELRRGRFSEALTILDRTMEFSTAGNPVILAETVCDLGCAHRGLGQVEKALRLQRQALATMLQQGFLLGECEVRIELAITLRLAGENDEAQEHLRKALAITHRINVLHQRAKALDVLATITKDPTLHDEATAIYTQLGLPRPPTPPTLEE
jgi:tetratricopeptide (TPR) repeat protein